MNGESMKKKTAVFLILAALALSACTAAPAPVSTPAPVQTPAPTPTAAPVQTPCPTAEPEPESTGPVPVSSPEEIQAVLRGAIAAVCQPETMDVSAAGLSETPELDALNLYYGIMSRSPELKYAYDISTELENGILKCRIYYMPYKTGEWPENEAAVTVSSLGGLLRAAQENIGGQPVPIRMENMDASPDDMNRVLQQAGAGLVLCQLNRDGTALTYSAAPGQDMDDCLALLREAEALAAQIVSRETDGGMTQLEKAAALYAYVTENVRYDHRYYSDPESMPFESQTAIGVLRDGLAICGGYSNALRLLFEAAGIPCYNIAGFCGGETHMWSLAQPDGEWLWFDATADRGMTPERGFRHFALSEMDGTRYDWDRSLAQTLMLLDRG